MGCFEYLNIAQKIPFRGTIGIPAVLCRMLKGSSVIGAIFVHCRVWTGINTEAGWLTGKPEKTERTTMKKDDAIARNLLVLVIVAVVVVVVAVGAVLFLTQPQMQKVPAIKAMVDVSGSTLYIYHDGGDPMQKDLTVVKVNGAVVPLERLSFLHGQDWPWTPGKTLKIDYPGPDKPRSLDIVWKAGGKESPVFSYAIQQPVETKIPVVTLTVPPVTKTVATPPPATAGQAGTLAVPGTGGRPQPPQANFIASPKAGDPPLTVQFSDISLGSPQSYLWSFGDGATSTDSNPSHTYYTPGAYTVSLLVSGPYGSDRKTLEKFITVGTPPAAAFIGTPLNGQAPLSVQFTDLSTGEPTTFAWNFGDGLGSAERNPAHIYTTPGTYSVSLAVTNPFGSNSKIHSDYITVKAPNIVDINLIQSNQGYLEPRGFIQFRVMDDVSTIKIGGTQYRFGKGDVVQLIFGESELIRLTASDTQISELVYDDVTMFVNGKQITRGIATNVDVRTYDSYVSTLTLVIPAGHSPVELTVNAARVADDPTKNIILSGLRPDTWGRMNLEKKSMVVSYRGGAESYKMV